MSNTSTDITLEDEIACVQREIRKRLEVYPKLVRRGTMTEDKAQHEIAVMTQVLKRLEAIRQPGLFGEESLYA